MFKYLEAFRALCKETWEASWSRNFLQGSFFCRWLIPDEATSQDLWVADSWLARGGNVLLAPFLKALWWLGNQVRTLVGASRILLFLERAWHASLASRGLGWWRNN
jgi:hypothetical protein